MMVLPVCLLQCGCSGKDLSRMAFCSIYSLPESPLKSLHYESLSIPNIRNANDAISEIANSIIPLSVSISLKTLLYQFHLQREELNSRTCAEHTGFGGYIPIWTIKTFILQLSRVWN